MGDGASGQRRRLRVTVVGGGARLPEAAGLGPWLSRAAPARARGALTVALVSDSHMRRLNTAFRRVEAATDVLSFPAGDGPGYLGDIAIARGVARRQARAEGHALRTELRVLALHGLLHLLGYDHETDDGLMRRAEDRLRRRAGLPSGLTARAQRGPRRGPGDAARRGRRVGRVKR